MTYAVKRCKFCNTPLKEQDIVRIVNNKPVCEACSLKLKEGRHLLLFMK